MKLKNSTLMALSEMVDAMGIKDELTNLVGKTNEEVGTQLLSLLVTKLYKVEKQYYKFVIKFKNIKIEDENLTEEEKEVRAFEIASEMDAIEIIKDLGKVEGIKDFLVSM